MTSSSQMALQHGKESGYQAAPADEPWPRSQPSSGAAWAAGYRAIHETMRVNGREASAGDHQGRPYDWPREFGPDAVSSRGKTRRCRNYEGQFDLRLKSEGNGGTMWINDLLDYGGVG
jgi:hypothetical protein